MVDAKDTLVIIIIGLEDEALSKLKEDHITEIEKEHEKYMLNIRDMKTSFEPEIALSETLLCPAESQPATAAIQNSAEGEKFKPQSNLKPSFLDKASNHLEVRNFIQNVEVYITTGFKDAPPSTSVGVY